jgi:SAM-dependent methyltransferase
MPMLRRDRVMETLASFADCARSGKLATLLPAMQPGRLYVLRSMLDAGDAPPAKILRRMNIDYMPGDARHTGLPDGCADLVFSNLVLGYVRRELLPDIMTEFRRAISPGGVMSHLIDMSDLYAAVDKRITPYNFLRYSTPTWRLLNNDVQHLNRLRITDYRELHESAGFRIVHEECAPGSIEKLNRVPLAREFRRYSREDLAVLTAWIVSRPR